MDAVRTFGCRSHRVLGNISLHIAQFQIVACVQHTAVGIPAAAHQIILALLRSRNIHGRSFKMLCQKCLGNLGSEISKINAERIAAVGPDVFQGLHHVNLTLHNTHGTLIDGIRAVFCRVSRNQGLSSVHGQTLRKTVPAHGHDTDFYLW